MEWSVNEIEKHATKGRQLIILKRQVSVLQSRIMTKQNLLEDLQASINQSNVSHTQGVLLCLCMYNQHTSKIHQILIVGTTYYVK